MRRFKLKVVPGGYGKAIGKRRVIRRAKRLLTQHRGGGYEIKQTDGYSHPRTLKQTLDRLGTLLGRSDVGDIFTIRAADGYRIRIRTVEVHVHADAPSGARGFWHDEIVHAYEAVFGHPEFRRIVEFWGAYNCRPKVVGSGYSMHSDWPPVLAIDFGCSPEVQDRLEKFLLAHIPGGVCVTHRDNSAHGDHLHFQIGGNRTGTPRCAA